jgi:hypothetical protein
MFDLYFPPRPDGFFASDPVVKKKSNQQGAGVFAGRAAPIWWISSSNGS